MGYAFVDLDRVSVDADALASVKGATARAYKILPLKRQVNWLYVAMSDPPNREAIAAAMEDSGCRIIPVFALIESIERALQEYYAGEGG